jgi:hypothetical protein
VICSLNFNFPSPMHPQGIEVIHVHIPSLTKDKHLDL